MNVAIVGNSNCVFANGFSYGVKKSVSSDGGVVKNYSLGGSCCALHIYTFHDKYSDLVDADVVILDSLIIDSFHLKRNIVRQDELVALIDDMYALYSQLPGKVVSVLFPTENYISNYRYLPAYKAHHESASRYGVDVLDLYKLLPSEPGCNSRIFMQPSHIKTELASEIGYRLTTICKNLASKKGERTLLETPYEVVNGDMFEELECVSVDSSYCSNRCYKLDRDISLGKYSGKSLVGVLHWNKSSVSKFVYKSSIEHDVVHLRSKYAFFEVLNSRRMIDEESIIRSGQYSDKITQKPAGKYRDSDFGQPHLAGLLLRDSKRIKAQKVGDNLELNNRIGQVFA